MFIVYCGEDTVTSRNLFLQNIEKLKSEGNEVVNIQGKDLSEETLEIFSGSKSLFGQKRTLAIENFLSLGKLKEKEKTLQKILSFKNEDFIFWEEKTFSKAEQQKYPDFIFKTCKLTEVVFSFLDKIRPNFPKENLTNFQLAISGSEVNFIFLMIVRQIRLLILAKDDCLDAIAPWQKSKLIKQAGLFEIEKLKVIYSRLLEIDYQQKNSSSALSLEGELELLLADI